VFAWSCALTLASCAGGGSEGTDAGPSVGEGEGEGEVRVIDAIFEASGAPLEGPLLDLGAHDPSFGPLVTSMALRNGGDEPFTLLSEPPLLLAGVNADEFSVSMQIAAPTIGPGEAAPFSLTYAPRSGGAHVGTLLFAYGVETEERVTLQLRAESTSVSDETGVSYAVYEGQFSLVPDFDTLEPIEVGALPNFDITPRAPTPDSGDNFAFRFNAELQVPTDGSYTFYLTSDDGSLLSIDGAVVVDNNGLHAETTLPGTVELTAGRHAIVVGYFEATNLATLRVEWEGPNVARAPIPTEALFH
jgi:hypothetical protein